MTEPMPKFDNMSGRSSCADFAASVHDNHGAESESYRILEQSKRSTIAHRQVLGRLWHLDLHFLALSLHSLDRLSLLLGPPCRNQFLEAQGDAGWEL